MASRICFLLSSDSSCLVLQHRSDYPSPLASPPSSLPDSTSSPSPRRIVRAGSRSRSAVSRSLSFLSKSAPVGRLSGSLRGQLLISRSSGVHLSRTSRGSTIAARQLASSRSAPRPEGARLGRPNGRTSPHGATTPPSLPSSLVRDRARCVTRGDSFARQACPTPSTELECGERQVWRKEKGARHVGDCGSVSSTQRAPAGSRRWRRGHFARGSRRLS